MTRGKAIGCSLLLFWFLSIPLYIYFGGDRLASRMILNNSGARISFESEGLIGAIDPGEIVQFKHPQKTWDFAIQTADGKRRDYVWKPLDIRKYVRHYRIHLQVEQDFKVYVIPGTPTEIVHHLPDQPPGFPLTPRPP